LLLGFAADARDLLEIGPSFRDAILAVCQPGSATR